MDILEQLIIERSGGLRQQRGPLRGQKDSDRDSWTFKQATSSSACTLKVEGLKTLLVSSLTLPLPSVYFVRTEPDCVIGDSMSLIAVRTRQSPVS